MATVFGKGFSIMADNALFDTNVLLDCAIQGRPGHDDAVALLDEIIAGRLVPYACATSLKDIYYVLTKHMGERDARRYVAALLDAYRICPVDRQICQSAIQSDEPDFDADHIADPLASGFSEGNANEIESGEIISGETLEELAENIRNAGAAPNFDLNGEFQDAVARYNAHVEAGETDDFGRACTAAIKTGPFYALEMCPTMLNTQGGPRHNGQCQVLDLDSMPIQGLFSAGELGSIFPDMYNGGGNLGETMVFGRIAGTNAALRAKGEFEGATEPATLVSDTATAE